MHKGQEILHKIENLLIEIDQPSTQRFFKKNAVKTPTTTRKEPTMVQTHQKSIQVEKNKVTTRLKSAQLWENPETFKVKNKTSLYLLSQKPLKPIHLRVDEIQRKKSLFIEKTRAQHPDPQIQQQQEEEAIAQAMEQRRRNQKKYSLAEVQEKMKELQDRERKRKQKKDLHRAQLIRKEAMKITSKPTLMERSQEIWGEYKEKKELSSSVFARFEQYELKRRQRFDKRMKELKQIITPFAPKISTNSRIIASHLTSRRELTDELNRSLSCRCFQRSTSRSLSKSKLQHNRSTALQTSRQL